MSINISILMACKNLSLGFGLSLEGLRLAGCSLISFYQILRQFDFISLQIVQMLILMLCSKIFAVWKGTS